MRKSYTILFADGSSLINFGIKEGENFDTAYKKAEQLANTSFPDIKHIFEGDVQNIVQAVNIGGHYMWRIDFSLYNKDLKGKLN